MHRGLPLTRTKYVSLICYVLYCESRLYQQQLRRRSGPVSLHVRFKPGELEFRLIAANRILHLDTSPLKIAQQCVLRRWRRTLNMAKAYGLTSRLFST